MLYIIHCFPVSILIAVGDSFIAFAASLLVSNERRKKEKEAQVQTRW